MLRLLEKDPIIRKKIAMLNMIDVNTMGLLTYIFSLIKLEHGQITLCMFVCFGIIHVAKLWKLLGEVGLESTNKEHPLFGDVKFLVETTFVKQGYLLFLKDENDVAVLIGPRGKREIKPSDIWEHVCELTEKNLSAVRWKNVQAEDLAY